MQKKKNFSGYPGDCSDQQLQALAKFRDSVTKIGCSNPPYDDAYLLRFLRARKFDQEKTLQMWQNYINWRKEKNVDSLINAKFPEIYQAKQFYPHGWFRTDKLGRPIYIERVGKLSLDKLQKVITFERLQEHFVYDYEKLLNKVFPACSKAKGEVVCNTCYIIDLKGAAANMMSSKVWDFLKMTTKIGQDYYPEILGTMFIINAPMFFYGVWNIVKHFVDEKTRNKIQIFGSGYKKELLKVIDEENLPDFLGGKATEQDYGANLTNEQGPWVVTESVEPEKVEISEPIHFRSTVDKENPRGSIELDNEEEEDANDKESKKKSLSMVMRRSNSIDELGDIEEGFEVGQESPVKFSVKSFRSKPSMSFNRLPTLKGKIEVGV